MMITSLPDQDDDEMDEECEVRNSKREIIKSSPDVGNNSNELELWIRVTPGKEYIKIVVHRGKVIGALLIGDTEMEETFENLIFNALDVSRYGISLLDPELDINDYFD